MKTEKLLFQFGEKEAYTDLGCSPVFLDEFCTWLQTNASRIASVDIALYLFNNLELYNTLETINQEGCRITIYSIPLEGYDKSAGDVFNHETSSLSNVSKYDLAKYIYNKLYVVSNETLSLRIVPHIFLRSQRIKPFSRGTAPYSLHCKTACVQFKDGRVFSIITSSNMAVRDAKKHEVAVLSLLNHAEAQSARDFFDGLYQHSIPIGDFVNTREYTNHRAIIRPTPQKTRLMYVAPFYQDSAFIFEDNICTVIKKATKRIVVCAQHISAYQYYYPKRFATPSSKYSNTNFRPGFLSEVLQKSKEGISVTFLSQTYSDAAGDHNCPRPENRKAFIKFVEEAKKTSCSYYQSGHVHCKFIVADDIVIVTTCNFTPTQFIYLPNVNIDSFDEMPNYSYHGTHCEYGVYQIVQDAALANEYVSYAAEITKRTDTRRMF